MSSRTNDVALLFARIAIAALFLPSGLAKLSSLGGFTAMLAAKGMPVPDLLAVLAVAAEILAPAAVILGVAPRVAALALIVFTLAASLISHSFWTFTDPAQASQQQIQFLKNMAVVGGLLFYYVSGPGAFSVSRFLGRSGNLPGSGNPARA